jgi:enoyl-CoA hydratase/carnithine racemase
VDLREFAARTAGDDSRRDFERFVDALSTFAKPLLCAVNGLAVGVGATMLGLADLVLMSEDARIQLPFAARSILPEAGSTFTLQTLLGPQQAAWAMLSGSWLSAADCLAAGLAWRVFPRDDLLAETRVCAETIAAHPVETLVEIKTLLRATSAASTSQARERESRAYARWSRALRAAPH